MKRRRSSIFNSGRPESGRTWFRFENRRNEKGEADLSTVDLYIDDEIGGWGVAASDLVAALHSQTADVVNVKINSPGGDVFEGIAIHNALSSYPGTVNTHVTGLAASAASFIAQAGKKRTMGKYAQMMIHKPSALVWDEAPAMRRMADLLDKIEDTIIGLYVDRGGDAQLDWPAMLAAETWMTADETVECGLADEVDQTTHNGGNPDNRWDLKMAYRYGGRNEAPAPVFKRKAPVPAPAPGVVGNVHGDPVPEPGKDKVEEPPSNGGWVVDLDALRGALRDGIDPPAPPLPVDEAAEAFASAWNPDVMAVALQQGIDSAVYNPPPPAEPEAPTFESAYDPMLMQRAILEGMSK